MVLSWPHEVNGEYSAYNAYEFVQALRIANMATSSLSTFDAKKVWNINYPPKLVALVFQQKIPIADEVVHSSLSLLQEWHESRKFEHAKAGNNSKWDVERLVVATNSLMLLQALKDHIDCLMVLS
ncbi:hypothetical protein RJT34_11348 [Clitoria ternatea]|uniref:Uncharacterized protein n=1 Tax=Clitoria ternatea TaxID=43366 RepID=A0AAN9JKD4_CLITE